MNHKHCSLCPASGNKVSRRWHRLMIKLRRLGVNLKLLSDIQMPHGIDISNLQLDIDWVAVGKSSQVVFAWMKATEGHDWLDKYFQANWEQAPANGVIPGAYLFFRADDADVVAQATFFCQTMGAPRVGDLPPQFDLENTQWDPQLSVKERVDRVLECCYEIWKQRGQQPLIYSFTEYIRDTMGGDSRLAVFPLWLAWPDSNVAWPPVPAPFKVITMWQYSWKGDIPGISNYPVDLDVFNGSMEQLNKFRYGMQPAELLAEQEEKFKWLETEVMRIRAARKASGS